MEQVEDRKKRITYHIVQCSVYFRDTSMLRSAIALGDGGVRGGLAWDEVSMRWEGNFWSMGTYAPYMGKKFSNSTES